MNGQTGWRRNAALAIGLAISAAALFIAANAPIRLGLLIYTEQVMALMLGLSLAACFVTRPVFPGSLPARSVDFALAALGLGVGVWLAFRYPMLSTEFFMRKTEAAVLGFLLIPLILEAVRRVAGLPLTIITAVFIAYAFVAHRVPGTLQGRSVAPFDFAAFAAIDSLAIFGLPLMTIGTVVVAFILFGRLLQQSGGAAWFTDISAATVGRFRGGPAKIAVVASGLFGSISGSAVANVASTGIVTIRLMKKAGLPAERAGAYEAVASTGGQIMPPIMGAAAFVMAEFLQVPYANVVLAALIPALLFYFAVLLAADYEAARRGVPGADEAELPNMPQALRSGWFFVLPFVVLVWLLFAWNKGPAEAALWSGLVLIAVSLAFSPRGLKLGPRALVRALALGGIGAVDVVLIGAAAGLIIGVLETSGLSFGLTYLLVSLGQGNLWILLAATAIICIVLGMGMPTTGIYLLLATLAAPPLIQLGVQPVAAHMFVLYFGLMSMITPPVAIAAFTAASIAESRPMRTAMEAVKIGWIAFAIPFLFVADPALLMVGTWPEILYALVKVTAGVWAISAGIVGYLATRLSAWERIVAVLAGAALLLSRVFPDVQIALAAVGIAVFAGLYLLSYRRSAAVRAA